MREATIGVKFELDKMLESWKKSILYWADQSAQNNNHDFIEMDDLDVAVRHLISLLVGFDIDKDFVDNPSVR